MTIKSSQTLVSEALKEIKTISKRDVVLFKPSKEFKKKINQKNE